MAKTEIRNVIRRLRFEHGEMTQQALAEHVGCTRQTILLLEQGRYVPSLALALRIARVFGRTVDEVFQLEGGNVIAALLVLGLLTQALRADRYGLVLVRHADTVAVERVTRDAAGLAEEILVPGQARLTVSAVTDLAGCVTSVTVQTFPWGSAPGVTPVRRVTGAVADWLAALRPRDPGSRRSR